jgi:hypothetical protein
MKYYLYQHVRLDTNTIFYIGKGKKQLKGNVYRRAYTKNSRNNYWLNIVNMTSYRVEILEEFEIEKECLLKETDLIIKYGYSWNNTGILCNMVKDDSEIKLLAREASIKANSKEVHQYSLSGQYIQSFSSINDAIKKYPCDIYNAASRRHSTAGGFQWRLYKKDNIDAFSRVCKTVYQYSLDNTLLKEWNGTKEPSEELSINRGAIRNCLSGIVKTAGNFKWSYSKLLKDNSIKKYEVYKENQLIYCHNNLKKCAEYLNLNPFSVSVYLRRNKVYKGYTFKYNNTKTQKEKNEK